MLWIKYIFPLSEPSCAPHLVKSQIMNIFMKNKMYTWLIEWGSDISSDECNTGNEGPSFRDGDLTTRSETHSHQLRKGQQTLAVSCFLFYFFPMLRYCGYKQHIKDESSSSLLPRLGGKVLHLQPHNNLYGCVDIFSLQNFCPFEITLGKSKVLDLNNQKCFKKNPADGSKW